MELLARFELATSSLPKISRLFCLVADYRVLSPEALAPQRVSGFSFYGLPCLAVPSRWRLYGAGVGFVAVSINSSKPFCFSVQFPQYSFRMLLQELVCFILKDIQRFSN